MSDKPLRLGLTGDVVPMGDGSALDGDRDPGLQAVADEMRACDVMIGSLLPVLSDAGHATAKMINIRAPRHRAADLASLGFDLLHLANNHAMDFGPAGLAGTIEALAEAGLGSVGAGESLAEASRPAILERDGATVGVLAWSTTLPAGSGASEDRPGVNPLPLEVGYEFDPQFLSEEPVWPPTVRSRVSPEVVDAAVAQVADLRDRVDYVVAAVHWGSGFGAEPATMAQPFGRALIDAGAHVVLGTHPHLIHGIEVHRGRPILYSPGMFIDQTPREGADEAAQEMFDMISPHSYVAVVELAGGSVSALRLVPTTVGVDGFPRRSRDGQVAAVHEQLARMSRRHRTELVVEDGDILVRLAG
jgi:poly-gamma-glutamate capsule biosynthesis protein CapA/YwtB (metallophosphatase superfamily)